MVTRYDVTSGRWSRRFWVKMHVFSTSFSNKNKACRWNDLKSSHLKKNAQLTLSSIRGKGEVHQLWHLTWKVTYLIHTVFYFMYFLWKTPFLSEHTILIFSKQYRELESQVLYNTIRVECYQCVVSSYQNYLPTKFAPTICTKCSVVIIYNPQIIPPTREKKMSFTF